MVEPMDSVTRDLVICYEGGRDCGSVCCVSVVSTVRWRQISVLLFTHVTMVVSVWEPLIPINVGVQPAMEAPTVNRVSSAGPFNRKSGFGCEAWVSSLQPTGHLCSPLNLFMWPCT
jgi:hypothetical protein